MVTDLIPQLPPIEHQHEFNIPIGEIVDLMPGIRCIVAPNPSPYTYTGTGTFIIGKGEDTIVIDPGPDLENHVSLIQEVLADCPNPRYLITHTHSDHSTATAILKKELGGLSYGFGPHGGHENVVRTDLFIEESVDSSFVPDITLNNNDTLESGIGTLQSIHTPGHTSNHMCFYLPAAKILFTGDHIMGWSTSVVIHPDGRMDQYKKSLQKVIDMDVDLIIPSHGPSVKAPRAYIKSLLDHRHGREEQIIYLLAKEPMMIEEITAAIYPNHPPSVIPAAMQVIQAHLLDMINVGTVVTKGPLSKRNVFTLRK